MDTVKLFLSSITNNKNTFNSYRQDINSLIKYFPNKKLEKLNEENIIDWKESLKNKSSATINRKIGTVKRYYDFLVNNKYIKNNPCRFIKLPKIHNKEKIPLTKNEVNDIINAGKNSRDKAITCLLFSTGIRISELINIKINDIHNREIKILGKGNKERFIYLNDKCYKYILEYIKDRPKNIIENLFISDTKKPMNPQSINRTLKCLGRRANIKNPDRLHNHLCRTTNATLSLQNNIPIEDIQVCLGHSNIETTMRYAKIVNEKDVIKKSMSKELF